MAKQNIQSVRISKRIPLKKAEKIVEEMGFSKTYRGKRTNELDKGESKDWWRFRQIPPNRFQKNSFRTKILDDDIQLIVGKLIM